MFISGKHVQGWVASMRSLTVSLLVCCVLLVAAIFAEVTYYNLLSSAPLRPSPDQYQIDVQDTDKELEFPPMSYFREIVDRPLFNPSRRPIVASAKPMPLYRFRGALLMGKHRIGLLERRSDRVLIRVREGYLVGEWQITSIDSRSIQVSSSTQTHTMTLADTLAEDTLFNNIQQNEQGYKKDGLQEGRKQENDISSNSNRWDAHTGRTCSQRECRRATLAALIARLPAPPPPPLQTPDH